MQNPFYNHICDIAKLTALEAGVSLIDYLKNVSDIGIQQIESNGTPTTTLELVYNDKIMDILCKNTQQSGIGEHFPIFSEHSKNYDERKKYDRFWLVDPIDGTKNLLRKNPYYTICIGFVEEGMPVAGAVYQPAEDRLFFAARGNGAYLNEKKEESKVKSELHVSDTNQLQYFRALIGTSDSQEKVKKLYELLGIKVFSEPVGSFALKLCIVAAGSILKKSENHYDVYIKPNDQSNEWDSCAAQVILEEAGGKITDLYGSDIFYNKENPKHTNGIIASNGKCHDELVQKVREYLQRE